MRIIRLQAENIKRLVAIDIEPDGNLVVISGKNKQGKTSVLDCIVYALAGAKNVPAQVIRKGQEKGYVKIDLDEYVVTWTCTKIKNYLKIENKEGAIFRSPQALLDKMVGEISFDPLKFIAMDETKQVETLINLSGIKVDENRLKEIGANGPFSGNALQKLKQAYTELYDSRSDLNRDVKKLEGALSRIIIPEGMESSEPVSVAELFEEKRQLELVDEKNGKEYQVLSLLKIERGKSDHAIEQLDSEVHTIEKTIRNLETDLVAAKKYRDNGKKGLKKVLDKIDKQNEKVNGLKNSDYTEIDKKISEADNTNDIARKVAEKRKLTEEFGDAKTKTEDLTAGLNNIRDYKESLVLKSQMPLDGLNFQDSKVTYEGIELSEISNSEKWIVGLHIAMALNPKIRVIRITDGSLLDSETKEMIKKIIGEKDYQLWFEEMDESGKLGVVIEDGEIKNSKRD